MTALLEEAQKRRTADAAARWLAYRKLLSRRADRPRPEDAEALLELSGELELSDDDVTKHIEALRELHAAQQEAARLTGLQRKHGEIKAEMDGIRLELNRLRKKLQAKLAPHQTQLNGLEAQIVTAKQAVQRTKDLAAQFPELLAKEHAALGVEVAAEEVRVARENLAHGESVLAESRKTLKALRDRTHPSTYFVTEGPQKNTDATPGQIEEHVRNEIEQFERGPLARNEAEVQRLKQAVQLAVETEQKAQRRLKACAA